MCDVGFFDLFPDMDGDGDHDLMDLFILEELEQEAQESEDFSDTDD